MLTESSACPVQVVSPVSQAFFRRNCSASMPIFRATLSIWLSSANPICGPDGQRTDPPSGLLVYAMSPVTCRLGMR